MIFFLDGVIKIVLEDSIVLVCSGVGYQVYVLDQILEYLTEGKGFYSYIYHHIKEDHQSLYGFSSLEERKVYMKLLSVSGIGPKVASKVLSNFSLEAFYNIIFQGDSELLSTVPGVGKKMSERVILDLKGTLSKDFLEKSSYSFDRGNFRLNQDIRIAMEALGFSSTEVHQMFLKAKSKLQLANSVQEGIELLLKNRIT